MQQVGTLVEVQPLSTCIYHPQTSGLVECFNDTLKHMLCKFALSSLHQWPKWLPLLLFAIRQVTQAFTGFSPFELLYGWKPREVIDILSKGWANPEPMHQTPAQSVKEVKAWLRQETQLTQEALGWVQQWPKERYDRKVQARVFQ